MCKLKTWKIKQIWGILWILARKILVNSSRFAKFANFPHQNFPMHSIRLLSPWRTSPRFSPRSNPQSRVQLLHYPLLNTSYNTYKHASRNHLFDKVVMWKIHGRLSDTGIDCMVIDQGIYLGKSDALDNFWFIMAIHTGQHACFATISFIKSVQHRYRAFFLPKVGLAF